MPIVVGGAAAASPLEHTMDQTDKTRSGFTKETGAYESNLTSQIVADRWDAGTASEGTA